ncbi:MAG TPA: AAA family ATPase [Mycobacteriales bacterium]|jgi:adenylate kinase family enzyme|nr:AAA family ATPase [Mycobacteriales bacterium]
MPKVLITGMSGTGKSTALRILGERGHRVVETDSEEWSQTVTLPDGSSDWVWRVNAIAELLANHTEGSLFVAGCKSNQSKFYPRPENEPNFDHVALFSAPADVMLARIASRTDNPYGKTPVERALILHHLAAVEPLLRNHATIEIDASRPIDEVVRQLESLT